MWNISKEWSTRRPLRGLRALLVQCKIKRTKGEAFQFLVCGYVFVGVIECGLPGGC